MIQKIFISILLTLMGSTVFSQDISGLNSQIDNLLLAWPAQNGTDMSARSAEIIKLGPEAIKNLCSRLTAPGEGVNAPIEFALHGIAHSVSKNGNEKDRKMVSSTMAASLKYINNTHIQRFILSQIRLCGRDEVISEISHLLVDKDLADPACRVCISIASPLATRALLKNLNKAKKTAKMSIIQALGKLQIIAAFKEIAPYTSSSDSQLRLTALEAIAEIGYEPAYEFLADVSLTAPAPERTEAIFRLLRFAERLHENGKDKLSEEICIKILNSRSATESAEAAAALSLLAHIEGDKIQPRLLSLMTHKSKELRARVLSLSLQIKGAVNTASWIKKMQDVNDEVKAEICLMLGRRGDKTAIPGLIEMLKTGVIDVRLAAAEAGARLAGDDLIPELLELLKVENELIPLRIKSIMLSFTTKKLNAPLASSLELLPAASRVVALEILSSRRASAQINSVLGQTNSDEAPVRLAAMRSLRNLAGPSDIQTLMKILINAENRDEIAAVQHALIDAAGGQDAHILNEYDKSAVENRIKFLPILAAFGNDAAFRRVQNALHTENQLYRSTAVAAFAGWKDAKPTDDLMAIVSGDYTDAEKQTALDGYINIAAKYVHNSTNKVEMLNAASEHVLTLAQKKVILKTLKSIKKSEALILTEKFFADPVIQSKAAVTAAAIACSGSCLYSEKDIRIMQRAVYICNDPYIRKQIEEYLQKYSPESQKFISLFNGKDLNGWKRHENLPGHGIFGKWFVEEGVIVGMQYPAGKGGFLITENMYKDFDLRMEVKIEWPFDSGVFLRVGPDGKSHQVTLDYREGGETGGIYLPWTQGFVHHNKTGIEHFNKDKWNDLRIVCIGEPCRIKVWLNGELITNFQHTLKSTTGVPAVGTIALQVHPGGKGYDESRAMFRNIRIHEIK